MTGVEMIAFLNRHSTLTASTSELIRAEETTA